MTIEFFTVPSSLMKALDVLLACARTATAANLDDVIEAAKHYETELYVSRAGFLGIQGHLDAATAHETLSLAFGCIRAFDAEYVSHERFHRETARSQRIMSSGPMPGVTLEALENAYSWVEKEPLPTNTVLATQVA